MSTNKPIQIVLAQLNYRLCDYERNLGKIKTTIQQAADADLVVFSELAVSGYYPQDLVEEPDFLSRQDAALASILALSKKVRAAIVIGAVTRNTGVGKPLHNSLLFIRDGCIELTYDKQLLPTYNIFDERRHFEPGENRAAVVEINGRRVGFLICEDGWNDEERDYPVNPVRTLTQAKVDLVVSINASPSNVGKQRQRHEIFAAVSRRHNIPLIYVNQVGANDQIVFDGGSFLVDPRSGVVHELPLFQEAVQTIGFDGKFFDDSAPYEHAVSKYLGDAEFYYRQILLGLRDYIDKVGFKGVVVGSSGGIDSALTLALAADALGVDAVKAITMPSIYSSEGSVKDSEALCSNLDVQLYRHEIGTLFQTYNGVFNHAFGAPSSRLTQENVQARIRGTILMEFSNHCGHLVLSTGNKSEMSVGYATLYGDMNGGLNLIGDLYKTEVYALARYYNELHDREIIPRAILDKEPSAELAPNQRDTDSLPPYPVLDEILKLHIEGARLRKDEYERASNLSRELRDSGRGELIQKVLQMVARAEFKRRQAPPIIRCRARAFGNGRQMPIAADYGSVGK
ncbi:MAG: NAD+ synthase [Gammaproteobacteria bacterium]|nr:NAD+ synthase [Gammaproteobacteria bacterium]